MDRRDVELWTAAYERAWRAPGTGALAGIFTEDATYLQGSYEERVSGLTAIGRMWEGERSGPGEVFEMNSRVVAVEDDTAVVRVDVVYGDPPTQEYRDLWVIQFTADGRCRSFEEWPFWPGQPHSAAARGE